MRIEKKVMASFCWWNHTFSCMGRGFVPSPVAEGGIWKKMHSCYSLPSSLPSPTVGTATGSSASPMHSLSHRHNRTCIYHGTVSDSGREAGSKPERKQPFLFFVFFFKFFYFLYAMSQWEGGRGENFACITLFQFFPCMIEGMFGFGLERECLREAEQYIGRIMWYLCYTCYVQ